MRVAVGGGRGFIGGAVGGALVAAGHEVVPFGREGLSRHERAQALVWAGGRRGSEPAVLDDEHVAAPRRALAALAPGARVVYLSSAEVYGRQAVPFREDAAPAPESAYARAKLAGEATLAEACAAAGHTLVVLRPGVVYGPGQAPSMLVPACVKALTAGQPFSLSGDGAQTRDFVHVRDLAALVVAALLPGAPAGLYNAGTGREVAVRDAALLVARAVGGGAEALVRWGERPEREHEQRRYVLDVTRAAERLGWRAQVTLEAGVAELVPQRG